MSHVDHHEHVHKQNYLHLESRKVDEPETNKDERHSAPYVEEDVCSLPSVFLLDVGEEEVEAFEFFFGKFFFVKPNKVDHLRLEPNEEDCAQNHRENERTNFSVRSE